MWMYGPAGIGKTAIAQTVAKICAERERLASAFFFFRSDEGRNSAKHLVPTLAFEMLQQMPHTRDLVCSPTAKNPLIFSAPLERQIRTIILPAIIAPFPASQETAPGPMLFIIDGLDECNDTGMQQSIIQSFISLLAETTTTIRHKILIVSRPESHIVSTFSASGLARNVHHLCLDEWNSITDIEIYLRAELEAVKQTHPLKLYLDRQWPSDDSFFKLLHKSFESFAYASSAIRYIASHDRDPKTSLNNLLGLNPECSFEAHAELDMLYRHILENLDERIRYTALAILTLYDCRFIETFEDYGSILGEETPMVNLAIIKMSSVIRFESPWLEFSYYHTSFRDFLLDDRRSGELYLYSPRMATAVATAILSRFWVHPVFVPGYVALNKICGLLSNSNSITVDILIDILRAFLELRVPESIQYRVSDSLVYHYTDKETLTQCLSHSQSIILQR